MKAIKIILSVTFLISTTFTFGQKGKHGTPPNITGTNNIVNEFTTLSSDAAAGATTINVANSSLNANSYSWFGGNLEAGDLVLIIQMQGADIDGAPEPWSAPDPSLYGLPHSPDWGQITSYNNCGNNEYAEVKSVPNGTSIELRCGLENGYTAAGTVQIIRVPRFYDLTIDGTLTTQPWDGSTGGVLALEVENNLLINGTGQILASELGFRGSAPNTGASLYGVSHFARPLPDAGGLKGESVRGWGAEYDLNGGRYAMGAPANGGGGGNAHNAGGGGGGNAGNTSNWNNGVGVPDPAYNNAWDEEAINISNFTSSGGGRGGYTISGTDQNANNTGPGDASWGQDNRQNRGGLGGRPLDYSNGKIYLGGGGGAGDLNETSTIGGGGGNGGGIISILNYGTVSGNGSIISNGENGEGVTASSASFGSIAGNDGAGGAGAGGTIIVNSNGAVSGISIITNGGDGGNQTIIDGGFGDLREAEGPGGGGGGGYIAISNGAITRTANGGTNGITNSQGVTEFPPNGATAGGVGLPNESISNFYLSIENDTICSGTSTTLSATVNGTLPGGTTITWYDAEVNGTIIGTNTLTTGNLTANMTYYVGTCPGNYLIPVSVIISPPVTFNDAAVLETDENCGQGDGSITGITVSGGTAPLTYEWNTSSTPSPDLTSINAGSYTLVVIDAKNCSTTVGTYSISNNSTLVLDASSISISDENCGLNDGVISGITTTGGTSPFTYTWNGSASADEDLSNVSAGSYTLSVTDGAGCIANSGPHVISNIAGPTVNITGMTITNESCSQSNGSIVGVAASGGTTPYSYSWNGTTSLTADTTNLTAGAFTITVTDDNGCTDQSGPHTILNNAAPTLDSTSLVLTNETCGNTNGSITGISVIGGSSPFTYSWNGNTTLDPDTVNLSGGIYTLTVTDASGCSVVSNSITINNLGLTVDTSSVNIVNDACSQGSGSITGVAVSGGSSPYTYSWNGTTSLNADTTNLTAGTYTLTITDFVGCTFITNPYTVLNNSGPTIDTSAMVIALETCSLINGSISGITSSGGLTPFTYTWNGATTSTEDTTGIAGGNFTLVVTDANGCFSTMGPITVSSLVGPTIDTSAISVVNDDCYAGNGSILGITVSNGTAPFVYNWNGTNGNLDTSNLASGNYSLTVTDDNGCSASLGSIVISNSGAPTADFALSGSSILLDETLILTNTSSTDAISYSWSFGDGTTSTDEDPSTSYTNEGSYTICLVAYSASSCPDTTCKTVEVITEEEFAIGVPSAFSPNGDMVNDVLHVRGSGIASLTFMVYNRYGEKVFESDDINLGWDGSHNGKSENAGVFVYYVDYEYTNGEKGTLKGNVTLVK